MASLDGTTLTVTVPQRGIVLDVKRTIGQIREMGAGLIELFVKGREDALENWDRLDEVGVREGGVVFMLQTQGWCWDKCGSSITLSGEGLVATKDSVDTGGEPTEDSLDYQLVTGGEPMTEGRHYWEVEITKGDAAEGGVPDCYFHVGAVRPGLDHDQQGSWAWFSGPTTDAYYIETAEGSLYGNGKYNEDAQGGFAEGDRVGVLLDLDAGWLRFYRNGKRWGGGFAEGVTGPLVRAAELHDAGAVLTALPGAVAAAE